MIVLYDNPFSPFARKVRMALQFKEVPYQSIDALALAEHARLHAVNRRAEVPVLVDGDVVADAPSIRQPTDGVAGGGATRPGGRPGGIRPRARLERLPLRHSIDRGRGTLPARLVAEGPGRSDGAVPERPPLEREHADAAVRAVGPRPCEAKRDGEVRPGGVAVRG